MGKQMKIGKWLDVWFEAYAKPVYAPNTLSLYMDARERMQKNSPGIEEWELEDLLPVHFQTVMNRMADRYAKSTIRHIQSLYRMAYNKAMDNGLCCANPIDKTTLPKNATVKKVVAMTKEEQESFVQAMRILTIKDQFILMAYLLTGLRRGELKNLRWSDYDKSRKVLYIRRSKTESVIREVPVIPEVALILAHLWGWKRNKRDLNSYIFGGEEPLNINHLRYICDKTSRLAGIRHVSPHILRHSFATRLIEAGGEAKSLSLIIGHSDVSFTLKCYVHPDSTQLHNQMMLLSHVGKS